MERTEQAKEVWRKSFENLVDDMKGLTREQLASGFFELGWRAADENPPKGTSLIKWQTGEPKEYGKYLVSTVDGDIMIDTYFLCNSAKDLWLWVNNSNEDISAWCKLDDVKPYEEE